jgi:FkbM family methyltransferase
MQPEQMIFERIPYLLNKYDKEKKGVTIDIGVGSFNFYFEVFHDAGYKTYAIEPLPTENLKKTANNKNIELIEACILDYEGTTNIYSGIFRNADCIDVSSVNQDWWGITEKSKVREVNSLTLKKIVEKYNINRITYLKIDTEGSEYSIIKQLVNFEKILLPKIIEFEYGGGAIKATGIGGWESGYFNKTLNIISTCHKLGYDYLLLFDSVNEYPIEFCVSELSGYEDIFRDDYVYGNIIMVQKKLYNSGRILNAFKPTFIEKLLRKLRR